MFVQTLRQARRNNEFHFLLCCFAWLSRPVAAAADAAAAPTPYLIKKTTFVFAEKGVCGEKEEGGLHALCISISVKAKFVWFFVVYDSCAFYCLLFYSRQSTVFLNWFDIHFVMSFVTFWGEATKKVRSPRAQRVFFSPCSQQASPPPSSAPVANNNTFQQIPANTCIECYLLPSTSARLIGISFVYPIRLVPLPVIICYLFAIICTAFSLEFHYIDDKKLDKPHCHVVWLYSLLARPSTFLTQFWLLTLETLKTN